MECEAQPSTVNPSGRTMKSQARAFSLASFHMATACWWYTFPMSIDGTYNIEVETKLGTQTGTAKVTTQGDKLTATVKAADGQLSVKGTRAK